jgi:hypothetical protein
MSIKFAVAISAPQRRQKRLRDKRGIKPSGHRPLRGSVYNAKQFFGSKSKQIDMKSKA